jgi:integrase
VRETKRNTARPNTLVLEPFGGELVASALREARAAAGEREESGIFEERRVWMRPPPGLTKKFAREDRSLTRKDVGDLWEAVRAKVGLDRCRFHDIRHFHATWLLDCGCTAEDVAIQLHGHNNPRTVIEVYGHPSHELARVRLRRLTQENGSVLERST